MADLNVLRISRDTETSSTLVRHRSQLEEYDALHGRQVAGWVEDVTVSGSVNLDQRPSLGVWLREPTVHTWDTLKVVTQDRITRDDMHWWAFVGWCLGNSKNVIIIDDPSFDITTEDGRMIAGIKASQAAKYRRAVQEKRNAQLEYYRDHDLWSGGRWPFGYRAVRDKLHVDRMRFRLVPDPVTSKLVREAYQRLIAEGWALGEIVRDWNDRKILTGSDYQRHVNALENREGRKTEVKGRTWHTTTLRTILSSPTLLGYAVHNGKVRTREGLPVQWADPILEPQEFDLLQEVLTIRGNRMIGTKRDSDPITGVLFCGCTHPMHSTTSESATTKKYEYYICGSRSNSRRLGTPKCPFGAKSWRKDFLRTALEEDFLTQLGGLEITRRRFVPGHDRSNEIRDLRRAVDNLTDAIGQATSDVAVAALTGTLERHAATLAELEAEPVVPSSWEELGTGRTFGETWRAQDWTERGKLLRQSGIRLYVSGTPAAPDLHLYTPEDLQRRAEDAIAGSVDPSWLAEWGEQVEQWRQE